MPISTISQNISTIPEAGHRGVDVQTQFVIKQEDFQDHLQGTTVTELNALKTQINTTVSGMNDAVITINTKAGEASTSALNASNSASTATTKAGEASTSASQASVSATKASQWADNNYNVEVETGKYSAKHWSTVAQNTVNNKVDKVASTDNAIVRFNGTTGDVQNSGVIIDDNNNLKANSFITVGETKTHYIDTDNNVGGTNAFRISRYSNSGTYESTPFRIDSSGNVGIGVTPSAWNTYKALQIGGGSLVNISSGSQYTHIINNAYYNGSNDVYYSNGIASSYRQNNGAHLWQTAPSGTAGNPITWTDAMILGASGNLLLTSGTGGLGYGTGAGGTVTQLTSKSTDVTLNKPTGRIVTNGAALAAGATVVFSFFNNVYTADYDIIDFQFVNNANALNYNIWAVNNGPGFGFRVFIKNISASSLSDILNINFSLKKGAIA